jgi:PAS domain S-box-containing protein
MTSALPSDTSLFENAACGLLLTSTDGTILRANATTCEWLGYQQDELVGRVRVQDLLTVGARVFHQTHCVPILQVQGSVAEVQVEMRHRNQARLPMLINIVRRRHDDALFDQWALFMAADRRLYERQLLAARKAAETSLEARLGAEAKLHALNQELSLADRRKDEFLATLSHELRNPLAPMRSALEVLKLKSSRDPRTDPILDVFDRQLRHMTHLVDDLMEISRVTQGRMELRCAPIDLGDIVRSAAEDVHDIVAAHSHHLGVALPDAALVVDGDAMRLTQVIVNLLTNAAKYTPDGGQIWLRAQRDGDQALVAVRDNGIGIPPQSLGTIFEMFSQLEPALDRAHGGLGIGLALVRGIVNLHGGSISAASDGVGLGSEFVVRLPLSAEAPEAAPDKPASAPLGPMRILVVDDNLDAAETLIMALELCGFDARQAHTAMGGLQLAAAFEPQVALLDIGLPDLNGYELARRLRLGAGGDAMLLIAVTGWGQDADKRLALEAGFDHHLTKPIDLTRLHETLAGLRRR